MNNLVSFAELQAWSGYRQKSEIVKWLEKRRIMYETGKNGMPITTVAAINSVIVGSDKHDKPEEIEFS